MFPPVQTNLDLGVGNNVTPSASLVFNMGQKDIRFLNVWSENTICSNIGFHSGGNIYARFSGSYNELRDKPVLLQGPPGAQGRDGVDGVDGADGALGAPSRDGVDGVDGADGAPGAPSRGGVDGADGAPGALGRDGVDGADGAPGAPNRDGLDGVDGANGAPRASCRDGVDGVDGVSLDAPGCVATTTYTSKTQADVGFEVENLGESGSIWTDIASFPLTITATIPKTALTKYELGSDAPSQAPRDWSVSFFNELENQVGTDVRSGESFSILATQEYIVAPPLASVTKAVLTIPVSIVRNSTATRINEAG
jgi:hypothetical protein